MVGERNIYIRCLESSTIFKICVYKATPYMSKPSTNEMNTCMCKYIHHHYIYLMTQTKGLATHTVSLPVTDFDRSIRYWLVFNAKLGRHS